MALKRLRKYDEGSDIAYVMNEVAERGIVVNYVSASGGTGKPGDANNIVAVPTTTSGTPGTAVGILATDVVSLDLSRYNHIARFHRDEVPVCSPVTIVTDGYVYTNMVSGVPVAGQSAYYTAGGKVTATNTGSAVVGRFRGTVDGDGYVGVDVKVGV